MDDHDDDNDDESFKQENSNLITGNCQTVSKDAYRRVVC